MRQTKPKARPDSRHRAACRSGSRGLESEEELSNSAQPHHVAYLSLDFPWSGLLCQRPINNNGHRRQPGRRFLSGSCMAPGSARDVETSGLPQTTVQY